MLNCRQKVHLLHLLDEMQKPSNDTAERTIIARPRHHSLSTRPSNPPTHQPHPDYYNPGVKPVDPLCKPAICTR
jgi:hypothetical protein